MTTRAAALIDLVVHELRTPLTVALGSLRQAAGAPPDAGQQALIARALRSCERLDRLAAEMRDWTRIVAAPAAGVVALPLAPLAETAARVAADSRHGEVEFQLDVPPGLSADVLPHLAAGALGTLWSALARAADRGEVLEVSALDDDSAAVTLVARRPGTEAPDGDRFDAEWVGGLGFSMPLARAALEAAGARLASRHADDGRLLAISVRLAAGAPAR